MRANKRPTRIALGLLFAFFLALLTWLGYAIQARIQDGQLRERGSVAKGILVAKFARSGRYGTDIYVRFRFTVDGRAFEKDERVNEMTFNALHEGSPVGITYLTSNPSISAVDLATKTASDDWRIGGIAFVAALIGTFTWLGSQSKSRSKQQR